MSGLRIDTICLPRELVEEMLIRFIWGLCCAQSVLGTARQTETSFDNLGDIVAANDDMISQLLQFFPRKEQRAAILASVKEKTGFELNENFFAGEPTIDDKPAIKPMLDS